MIEKQPFRSYTLDQDKKSEFEAGKIFTIRLNAEEYKEVLEVMAILRISNTSTALKEMAFVGKNVISTLFKPSFLKWLTDAERRVDDSKLRKLVAKKEENVIQNLEKCNTNQ